ncbi:MAG TPA: PHB depolymerase family esterase [Nitrolancea sp.]
MTSGGDAVEQWKRKWRAPLVVLALVLLAMAGSAIAGLFILRAERAHAIATTIVAAGNAGSLPLGASTHTIEVNGLQRSYIIYRPSGLSGPAPLVVMLHGGFGSADKAESAYGWDAEADHEHFLVAYPNSIGVAWNTGGGCCGQAASRNVDDVGFIRVMIEQISRDTSVDQSRIYATGISNGGILAYTLACQTTIFAAIGPDSATQLGSCDQLAPISIIHIHGTADTTIPYNGGEGDGTAHINGPAIPALNAAWRAIVQCAQPAITTEGAVTTSIASCAGGRTVELISIAGAGHQWPGASPKPALQKLLHTDPPSTALDATSTIWDFFAQQHK